MATSRPDVLIAGASARAAAFSAIRGGLRVAAADLFADRDLAAIADVSPIESWPDGIEGWAALFPSSVPLLYTGGLENSPDLLDRIARSRPVAGATGDSLRIVRSPEALYEIMTSRRVPIAQLGSATAEEPGRWLVKPQKGGGGRGIRFLATASPPASPQEYVQEYVAGTAGSATFLASADGAVELIGTCESLQGLGPHASSFAYFGSITRRDWKSEPLTQAGIALAAIGLRGLFGIDFIRRANGECVLVEVNPRFTASAELHELAQGRSLVAEHLASFGLGRQTRFASALRPNGTVFGKRIVYASRDLTCDLGELPSEAVIRSGEYTIADLPRKNAVIAAQMPVCTVLACANSVEACRVELEQREGAVLSECVNVESKSGA